MDFLESFGVTGRTFKVVYYGNLLVWIILTMFLILFIILELMKDDSQSHVLDIGVTSEPFIIPDMNEIIMWGYNGQGVKINTSRLYPGHQEEYKDGFKKYQLNKYLSDRISMRRSLPDVRNHECRQKSHDLKRLPSVSVVVVFRNEPRTTLLRMLYSIIDRSPPELIQNIILVDNDSEIEDLQFPKLESYLSGLKQVSIIRLSPYLGTALARMYGAQRASGDVIIFLQPRCECTEGWIIPLLEGIVADRSTITVPVVDRIDYDTFQYSHETLSGMKVGSFTWELAPKKRSVTKPVENATLNVPNPVIADGIFAVDRDNLFKLGGFDEGLIKEESVNIEFSVRSWLCGSRVVLVPCSHVGYIVPMVLKQWPDMLSNETIKDRVRIAEGWMDSYKYFVYERMQLGIKKDAQEPNILQAQQKIIRPGTNISCKNFDWYLQVVEPSMYFTSEIERRGQIIMMVADNKLLSFGVKDGSVILEDWVSRPATFWYHLKSGALTTENKTCLSYTPNSMKAERWQPESSSPSRELRKNWRDSNQNQHQEGKVLEMKEVPVEKQKQDQLNSKIDLSVSLQDELESNLQLLQSKESSYRQSLDYVDQESFSKLNEPNQNRAQVKQSQNSGNFEKSHKSHETQIKRRSILNRILQYQDVTRSLVMSPISKSRLLAEDQPGNLTSKQEPEDLAVSDLVMKPCVDKSDGELWIYTEAQTLQHVKSRLCMEAQESKFGKYFLSMAQCDRNSRAQHWNFINTLTFK